MKQVRILIVDDEEPVRKLLKHIMETEGYDAQTVASSEEALAIYRPGEFHVMLIDIRLPGMDGLELLKTIKSGGDSAPVIMITAHGTVDSAVEAMRSGAFDYISKPFDNNDIVRHRVKNALERITLIEENIRLSSEVRKKYDFAEILSLSKPMEDVLNSLSRIIETNVTVLIRGESGTGKELVARAIHYNSPRRNEPFIVVNCSAIPDNLLESEIFGHEKGAFTGATAKRLGKFELADNGTLFLDEIGDMSYNLQAKFLRVLESQEFERVGGGSPVKVDVRVISATNKNLEEEVKKGGFREDLYYRLNVVPITLPPLRERKEDIPILIEHFLNKYNSEYSRQVQGVSADVLNAVDKYHWPGNVRELENHIKRMVLNCDGETIGASDLPLNLRIRDSGPSPDTKETSLSSAVESVERRMIIDAMEKAGWVLSRAAGILDITPRVLTYKLKKFGIKKPAIDRSLR